jgi:hypothetical protein
LQSSEKEEKIFKLCLVARDISQFCFFSGIKMPPKYSISDDSLTFGVELEFVFAFHQDELQLEDTNGQDTLEKNLSYFVRETAPFTIISQLDFPQHTYNSWGINSGGKPPTKPYGKEPQEALGVTISDQCQDMAFKIHDSLLTVEKTVSNYDKWQILKYHTMCGVGSKNIFPARLGRRLLDSEPENWDSIGLEAVSEVYNTEELDEVAATGIKMVVDGVKGKAEYSYGSFITNRESRFVSLWIPLDALSCFVVCRKWGNG